MTCALCKKPLTEFNPKFNQLVIDESTTVNICQSCITKFLKWQQGLFAALFPTSAAKKWVKRG